MGEKHLIGYVCRLQSLLAERSHRKLVDDREVGTRLVGLVQRRASGGYIGIGERCQIHGQVVLERGERRIGIGRRKLLRALAVRHKRRCERSRSRHTHAFRFAVSSGDSARQKAFK